MKRTAFVWVVCAVLVLGLSGIAEAQYGVRQPGGGGGAVGERYHVELGGALWSPDPDLVISSEQFGIPGTEIDAISDLGYEQRRVRDFQVVLRPSQRFKFRLGYTPISYEAETTLERTIVFNGQRYDVGLPINSSLEWKAWRFAIEYDFLYRERWFVGFIVDARYTDLEVSLDTPVGSLNEFTRVRVPVPTIGGIGRVYPARNLAVTFEMSGLKLAIDEDEGRYLEWDLNGVYNFTNNFGVKGGYRSTGIRYQVELDRGDLNLSGVYFGAVARF